MDLPFANFVCVQTSAQRSAGPVIELKAEDQQSTRGWKTESELEGMIRRLTQQHRRQAVLQPALGRPS